MTGFMMNGGAGGSHEPMALLMGVLGIITGVIFFLQKFNFIQLSFEISDITYMYFFAGFTLVAGIILLITTLGFLNIR